MNTTTSRRQASESVPSTGKARFDRVVHAGIRLCIATAAVAQIAIAAPSASAAPASHADHFAAQRALDRAVADGGVPGVLATIRDGRDTWVGAAGVADTETGRQRRQQDRFRVGSTTKTFTATVMLQLAAEHRLSLDDSVEKWLPGVVRGPGYEPEKITIRQLLNHTSGIYDYVNDDVMSKRGAGTPFLEHRFDGYRPEEIVRIGLSHPPAFAPGTGWGYSNTPYFLAGMIIERVTGLPLADAIAQRVARPLGLTATYLPRGDDPLIHGPHGRHYSKLMLTGPDAAVYDVTELNPSWGWAAGGVVSTTADLDRFFGALLGGRLLPPAQQREMFSMVTTKNWIPDTTYGLGVASQKLSCGVTVWGMGGAINGSWTYTFGTRNGTRMVSVNSNGDWNHPIAAFTDVLQAEFCPGPTPAPAA
ncbi:serine hydrolase domain-containing protein [Streptomyces sp. NBC_01565]|uniref:serine hydrolase domain-containing protein n=1 Tax=unclassified Streptomyces TaxID=2593676 RepID=UPI00224E550F|nr:serine hydrolase domain-containing protein [Streptomyces sp. NBC_01565]MCX4539873.1 beta-lactamase family protein [Streptomyces sp. NBC_01565]